MLQIVALRETQQWTGPSIVVTSLIVLVLLGVAAWLVYRYLQE